MGQRLAGNTPQECRVVSTQECLGKLGLPTGGNPQKAPLAQAHKGFGEELQGEPRLGQAQGYVPAGPSGTHLIMKKAFISFLLSHRPAVPLHHKHHLPHTLRSRMGLWDDTQQG